jgi:hypothetical protein
MEIPAMGIEGHLIRSFNGRYMFRVYTANHDFTDYDVIHSDLRITITDEDATLYSDDRGKRLDHCCTTLGIENDRGYRNDR